MREIKEIEGFKVSIESDMEKYRADSFLTKEPETIEWIKSFKDKEIFYDIGANIGLYSLYATKLNPELIAFAFEPDYVNYYRLLQNAFLNPNAKIIPVFAGMSNLNVIGKFFAKKNDGGCSGGQFHESIDENGKQFEPESLFFVPCFLLWDFVTLFKAWFPTHIKIDVDGQEERIFPGLLPLFGTTNLKTMLIEFNERTDRKWIEQFKTFGFTDDNLFNKVKPHSRERRLKEGIKAENIIFTRE